MPRLMVVAACLVLLIPATARAEDVDERVKRLEEALETQKRRYEKDVGDLRRRIEELEADRTPDGAEPSELDKLLEEANAAASAAEKDAGGPAGLLAAPAQTRLNAFNPRITAFGDFAYRLDRRTVREEEERIDDRASLRSFELDLRADVDPFAKAVAILGLHEHHPGEYHLHPEEVYVTFETLPAGLRLKVGRFLASMGVVNRLHPHDLPWATSPLVVSEWFGEEGMAGEGGELSWLVPQGFADAVELSFGLTNGEQDYLAGSEANDPSFLARAQVFETLSDASFLQVGTSHLFGWTDPAGDHSAWLGGLDVLYRWRPPTRALETSLFTQAELYLSDRETEAGTTRSLGGFATVQYQPMRDLYAGIRFDWLDPLDRFEGPGRTWAGGVWLSYYTSEFLRLRVGLEHRGIENEDDLDTLWLQLTFVFGSHPAEPWWFNK